MTDKDYGSELDELIASCTVIERDDNENDEKIIDVAELKASGSGE